jgi:hypothetical protein
MKSTLRAIGLNEWLGGATASTTAPFHQNLGVGRPVLAEAQPPIKIYGAVHMECTKAHGDLADSGMFDHLLQDMRAYPSPLKLRVYHKLTDMNVAITVFDAHVAAGHIITQDDFMGRRPPAFGEELVLPLFIPRPELPHRHISIRTMMHGAGKLCVGS